MKTRFEKLPTPIHTASVTTVECTETLLAEWFGAPVVLTNSGRSAIFLTLQQYGLSRHKDSIALQRFVPQCVMDTVTRCAFPVDTAQENKADVTLFYHQYGFTQVVRPEGRLVEDIAHSFFATADTGQRSWAGETAIFSIPKFFPTSSMVGGIIARDEAVAEALRRRRDDTPIKTADEVREESRIFRKQYQTGGQELELLMLARLRNPRVLDEELGGLPTTLEEIKAVGAKRRVVLDILLEAAGADATPPGWDDMLHTTLPYELPVTGAPERLAELDATLKNVGIASDIYHIDINRNQFSPNYQKMLLVPYSHLIPDDLLAEIVRALRAR